jgi:hypothetical protein
MVRRGDRLYRALNQNRVEQTESETDAEENSDHRMSEQRRRQRHESGEHNADREQS